MSDSEACGFCGNHNKNEVHMSVCLDIPTSSERLENITIFHADHGVETGLIKWALTYLLCDPSYKEGFFLRTLTLPADHPPLLSGLYGPEVGDSSLTEEEVFFAKRSEDRPASRMINRGKRDTRLLTIIGTMEGGAGKIFTAYGGPCAPREPGDPTLSSDEEKEESRAFWAQHALAAL